MTAHRPGRVVYVTNGSGDALTHGQHRKEGNFVGTCVKQKSTGWDSTVADQDQIADGEEYALIVKGKVLVDNVSGFAKGESIYIVPASGGTGTPGALTETSTNNTPFGRVTEAPDERGTPSGKCWIDLDLKP